MVAKPFQGASGTLNWTGKPGFCSSWFGLKRRLRGGAARQGAEINGSEGPSEQLLACKRPVCDGLRLL